MPKSHITQMALAHAYGYSVYQLDKSNIQFGANAIGMRAMFLTGTGKYGDVSCAECREPLEAVESDDLMVELYDYHTGLRIFPEDNVPT